MYTVYSIPCAFCPKFRRTNNKKRIIFHLIMSCTKYTVVGINYYFGDFLKKIMQQIFLLWLI